LWLINSFTENRAIYEIMWKNIVQPYRRQMTIWRMRIACWIPKATNTFSENVAVTAFPLLQRLLELTSMLRCAYTGCLVTAARQCCFRQLTEMTLLGQGQDKPGTISAPAWDHNHSGRPRRGRFYFIFYVEDILCVNVCSELTARSDQDYYWVGSLYLFLHWAHECFKTPLCGQLHQIPISL
jgi:hypothetical protein